jgi:hypothetical protein
VNDRELRHELEALQSERVQLINELREGWSRRFKEQCAVEEDHHEALIAQRRQLEVELAQLHDRTRELAFTRFELERRWDRELSALTIVASFVLVGVVPLLVSGLLERFARLVPLLGLSSSLGLGLLLGPRLVASWREQRTDWFALRQGFWRTFAGLSAFGGVMLSLLLLALGPAMWLMGMFLPQGLTDSIAHAAIAMISLSFLVSRRNLRRAPDARDWGTLTSMLAAMGVFFAVVRLREFTFEWNGGKHLIELTALFSLFLPLTGLFWTRRASHVASKPLALASALLASTWTVLGVVLHPSPTLGFSVAACATLGFVLASAVEEGDDRHEAQLFNAVALVGGLAVLTG